jgi:hypothetical protein
MRFTIDERVIFSEGGVRHRGRVTAILPRRRKVVTDSGKRFDVPVGRLRPSPDRVLILESRLDRNLRSRRFYGEMMQRWLSAYRVEALLERVHTTEDMRRFLQSEGRNIATRFIYISAHGRDHPRQGEASLHLTFDTVDLMKEADMFEGLRGKVIIFSSCGIGADQRVMQRIKDVSAAAAVIGYRKEVFDTYTLLAETLLFDRMIQTRMHATRAVDTVVTALHALGVEHGGGRVMKPVMVCY